MSGANHTLRNIQTPLAVSTNDRVSPSDIQVILQLSMYRHISSAIIDEEIV